MSDCKHVWAAVDSRRSQCRKCGEIAISPCRERECVAMNARIAELEAVAEAAVTYLNADSLRPSTNHIALRNALRAAGYLK